MTDKILVFSSASYQDPSADVRFWGKKIILLLSPHHGNFDFFFEELCLKLFKDFDKLCTKHLNGNDARTVIEAAHHLSINGIQVISYKV